MHMIALDFETYYAKDYTLSKLTTEEYVRDPRFEVIGVGIKFNDNPARWFCDSVESVLRVIPWDKVALLCHNTNFDGFILQQHFGIVPKIYLDTLSMARPWHGYNVGGSLKKLAEHYELGAKGTEVLNALGKRRADFTDEELRRYGDYCIQDVNLTHALFHKLKAKTPMQELLIIDRTVRMFCDPKLEINEAIVQDELTNEIERKQELMDKVEEVAPKSALMSNPQLALLLESLGVEPPMKTSARTGKETYAFGKTDKAFTALLEYEGHNAELVQAIVEARLGVKSTIGETRAQRFLGVARRGPLPVDLQYCGALVTQRWSGGSKQNLQNLPRGGALRRSLTAPEGKIVVAVDSSNIELRVCHMLAGQHESIDSVRNGRDLYCEFASVLFDRPITKADKNERQLGKLAMLSLQYGAGAPKFKEMCRLNGITLTDAESKRVVTLWRQTYDRIPALWRACDAALEQIALGASIYIDDQQLCRTSKEAILTKPNNQILYPSLQKDVEDNWFYLGRGGEKKKMWGGIAVENLCLAAGTLVLTESGWKAIEDVTTSDKVHDGVEFVTHGGSVYNGRRNTIAVDGVFMTPDHEVLTNEGWAPALAQPRPYRPNIRTTDRLASRREHRAEATMGVSLSVWDGVGEDWHGCNQGGKAGGRSMLQGMQSPSQQRRPEHPQNVQAPGVRSVAQHVRPLQTAFTSSMEKLWGAWDNSVQRVAEFVRSVLGRHGGIIPSWAYAGPSGQRAGVPQRQLPVGFSQRTKPQPPGQHTCSDAHGTNASDRRAAGKWHQPHHFSVSASAQLAGGSDVRSTRLQKVPSREAGAVYDIVNCGPRSRFVVLGEGGPFIVHNCQHLARNIVAEQLLTISAKYHVVLTVHDEVVYLADENDADEALEFGVEVMSKSPSWWPAIPLAAEGEYGRTYS